jgi:hypothetical protein
VVIFQEKTFLCCWLKAICFKGVSGSLEWPYPGIVMRLEIKFNFVFF